MDDFSIDNLIEVLENHSKYMTEVQVAKLSQIVKDRTGTSPIEANQGEVINDLMVEVREQMEYVRKFRRRVVERGEDATSREVKDMIQASTSLFSMLTRMNDDITNQDRLRKVENATVEAIKSLPSKNQQVFFKKLEELLDS